VKCLVTKLKPGYRKRNDEARMSNDEGIAIPSPWKAELGDADAVVAGVSPANMEKLQPARLPLQLHGGSRSLPLHLAVRKSQRAIPTIR
jgi:hypothetical protein